MVNGRWEVAGLCADLERQSQKLVVIEVSTQA